MGPEDHKAAYRRLIDAGINHGDQRVLREYLAPDFVLHAPGFAGVVTSALRTGVPDLELSVAEQVSEGDMVASRVIAHGTHRGVLLGIPPTGRPVIVTGISLVRFADGQLCEEWLAMDVAGLLQQLGRDIVAPSDATT